MVKKLKIRESDSRRNMSEAKRWGKYDGLHYLISGEDIEAWDQNDYIEVMEACRKFAKIERLGKEYGLDSEEALNKQGKEIQRLIDIANENAGLPKSQNPYEESMCEAGRMVNGKVSDLSTQFDSRKSFGGKAKVITDSDGTQILYSYNTPVVELEKGKKVKLLPQWDSSATTLRHVREFLLQNGFEAGSKAQIAKLYSDMTESRLRIKESDMIKFGSRDEDLGSLEYALEKYVGKPVAKAQQYLRDLGFDMFVMAGPSKRDETWEEYTTDKDNSGSVSVKLYFDLDSDPRNPRRKTNGKLTDFFVDRYS